MRTATSSNLSSLPILNEAKMFNTLYIPCWKPACPYACRFALGLLVPIVVDNEGTSAKT